MRADLARIASNLETYAKVALAGGDRHLSWKTSACRGLLFWFQFQARLVLFQKFTQPVGAVEQTHPLLVIERHREAAQPVNAHPALFANAKFQRAFLPRTALLLQLGNPRQQFFSGWFTHLLAPCPLRVAVARFGNSASLLLY